jgi:hypothetical protein
MDELVKLVAEKTGLPQTQAKVATQTVIDYLTAKLPAPASEQIKLVLASGGAAAIATGVGNLFAKKG